MNITILEDNGILNAKIEGRIDSTNAKEFELNISPLLESANKQIIMDLADLSYISSSGLRVFLILQKAVIAKGGKLVLRNMISAISEIFTITGFSSIFTIE